MVRAPRRRSALLLVCLAVLAAIVAALGAGAVTDLAQGLRVLGGTGATAQRPDGEDGVPRLDGEPGGRPTAVPPGAQRAVVDRVVDGDTVRVRIEEAGAVAPTDAVRVRLLNVDAPELDHPRRGRDCGAEEATALVEELTPAGTEVWLVADREDRDRYDRPLRAVFNHEGRFVNAELARAGWAEAVLFEPNDRFHERMADLAAEARAQRRGAWAACGGFP